MAPTGSNLSEKLSYVTQETSSLFGTGVFITVVTRLANGPRLESDKPNSHPPTPFLYDKFIFPPRSSKCCLPFTFPDLNFEGISHTSHTCSRPAHLRLLIIAI
jgi:hypothetical protein